MTRQYVNAIVVNDEVQPIGQPDRRLERVQKRVKNHPTYRWGLTEEPVVIAERDVTDWRVSASPLAT